MTAVWTASKAIFSESNLNEASFKRKIIGQLHLINNNEFIVVVLDQNYQVHKYNIITDEFKLLVTCRNPVTSSYLSTCYDHINAVIINIETKKMTSFRASDEHIGINPRCVYTPKHGAHLLGGSRNNRHIIYNHSKKQRSVIWTFKGIRGTSAPGIIYLKSKESYSKLIYFGGYQYGTARETDDMWQYVLSNELSMWKLMKCKLPRPMNSFGYVVTKDERYLIVFGGRATPPFIDDENMEAPIHVLDIEESKWYLSDIKCPSESMMEGIIMGDLGRDTILVYGYLRAYKGTFLPDVIMEMVVIFFALECVHLIDTYKGSHYNMSLRNILSQMTEM